MTLNYFWQLVAKKQMGVITRASKCSVVYGYDAHSVNFGFFSNACPWAMGASHWF